MVSKRSVPHGNKNKILSRKQQRKQKRKEKKIRRNEFYTNRKKTSQCPIEPIRQVPNSVKEKLHERKDQINKKTAVSDKVLTTEEIRKKEKREQSKIQKEMMKQRNKQLLEANIAEDRNIKQLEKQLKLNKRKSKSVPKSFAEDGLDYLLEICDSKSMQSAIASEQELNEVNEEFEEDFALMGDNNADRSQEGADNFFNSDDESNDNYEDYDNEDIVEEEDMLEEASDVEFNDDNFLSEEEESSLLRKHTKNKNDKVSNNLKNKKMQEEDTRVNTNIKKNSKTMKRKTDNDEILENVKKRKTLDIESDDNISEASESDPEEELDNMEMIDNGSEVVESDQDDESDNIEQVDNLVEQSDETWEDIYGRLRSKDGRVLNDSKEKYIPPAIRAKLEANSSQDKIRLETLNRLKKRLKGLLNRLAESNMHSIASQIEDLYMNNSRNDMNDTLTNLIMESLISKVITPERLLIEHVVLISILHANVGTEVGAHFLQTVVKKFDQYRNEDHDVENKLLDNTVNVISQLYNFKVFHSKLIYDILQNLSNRFEEKDIECILHILKGIGFALRKDDPLLLKSIIIDLQKRAANSSADVKDNPRVKFMLDILLAIKNNNVSKIPNYDTTYSDHLKKIMKGFIRKGNYVQQLNISLEDLLNADERGKWWIVGSAWTGNTSENSEKPKKQIKSSGFSEKLLALAAKQRMNTDVRRNIFCIIMSAEDYLDAFEKLLHLELKNQQEREIINVILHCCLHEKVYNPYYAVLAQKFCDYDRKYQIIIKYSTWDKLKALNDHSGSQISNLAKMLTHLFIEKGLPISTLKVVEFGELDKVTLRFIRQILLGILLHKDTESCLSVFEKVGQSDKLKMFRESLRLFIHHFLLKNLNAEKVQDGQKVLLETRAKMVEKLLVSKESKLRF